jgi:protein subunit release factor A
MKRIVEIRAAEGGADAQLFVNELARAFEALCLRRN